MGLDRSLLTDFAKAVNGGKNEKSNVDKFIRGTAKTIGGKKYVQLDGSNVTTPISETVDVEDGDRVLVSIENHKATILGNFTFPPSARKEQEAIDKAEDAQNGSNLASQKAEEAITQASKADEKASTASAQAGEAVKKSDEALNHATEANKNVVDATNKANQAVQDAASAKESAAQAQADIANANAEIEKINKEVTTVKGDVTGALGQLTTQASEIESIKETYSTKVETETVKADLTTEISKKVGELQTTVEQNYAAKNDVVAMEGKLQTQITQNAQGLSSQATKVEKLESDTAQAQADISKALENAEKAQNSAITAQENAATAQAAADKAKAEADNAKKKAQESEDLALKAAIDARVADEALTKAKTALDEAKKNYELIANNPSSTPQQIQQAQAAVDTATVNVNKALADAATAAYAADQAQKAADQAQQDASTAQNTAINAQNKADSATTLANNAQQAADKAQQEVAALTKRVETAETSITQNSEAIQLNANKTTEIGDKLKNEYYNKTETDAKIKVESDRINTTVSKVEVVEKKAVTSTIEEFYLSTSPTTLTGGSWGTTQPTWENGKYIWRRTKVTKGDGSTSYTPNQNGVCITGNTGATGLTGSAGTPGKDGKGVSSITTEFYLSTSKTTQIDGSWVATMPTWKNGKYLWTRNKIVYANPSSTVYTTPQCDSSWEAVNEVEVGGRNLLIGSQDFTTDFDTYGRPLDDVVYNNLRSFKTNRAWDGPFFSISKVAERNDLKSGDICTLQAMVMTNFNDLGLFNFTLYRVTEKPIIIPSFSMEPNKWYKLSATFTLDSNSVTEGVLTRSRFELNNFDKTIVDESGKPLHIFGKDKYLWIAGYKLEKGNKATDWTPAPEDLATNDDLNEGLDGLNTTITETKSSIEQLADQISHLIVGKDGSSMMTQDENGWHFDMSSITGNIEAVQKELEGARLDHEATEELVTGIQSTVDKVNKKTAYIDINSDDSGKPVMTLGSSESSFKVVITNESINFMNGTNKVAYASGNRFYAPQMVTVNSMQIGESPGFRWERRANGNLGLVYVSS